MNVSVVIPSAAAPDVFEEVLASVFNQTMMPYEVICVDDAMDQKAIGIADRFAKQYPIKVIKNDGSGVSAARNTGARAVLGDIILFIDTDVVLKPNAISLITDVLKSKPQYDGIVGVQSAELRFGDFFSRWKNHWMRFTYQRLSGDVHLFYTSCAAILKSAFLKSGGFDENYKKPSIEDTVFGAALGRMGAKILPVSEFEVEHVKAYTLKSVLKTDVYRSAALVKYALRNVRSGHGTGAGKTSVPITFMLSALLMAIAWVSLIPAVFLNPWWFVLPVSIIVFLWALNGSWLKYLYAHEDLIYCLKAMIFLPVDISAVNAGMIYGLFKYLMGCSY